MRLPRSLASLTGPSTPELQKSFLRDLKVAFRNRVEVQSAPIQSSMDRHLQYITDHSRGTSTRIDIQNMSKDPVTTARKLYVDGRLSKQALYTLIGLTKTREELKMLQNYSLKIGCDLAYSCTNLSARYAARLLHMGHIDEVNSMMAHHTKQWIAFKGAHPLLVQYASRTKNIAEARVVFDHLLEHDQKNLTTSLVRALLREAVRHNDLLNVLYCLGLDKQASQGQETGLARWLNDRGQYAKAFTILLRAEPSLAKEASVGLAIARSHMEIGHLSQALQILRWVEGRYALSVQDELRDASAELAKLRKLTPAPSEDSDPDSQKAALLI